MPVKNIWFALFMESAYTLVYMVRKLLLRIISNLNTLQEIASNSAIESAENILFK